MEYGSPKHNHAIEKEEITNMEGAEEIIENGHGHDLHARRQSAGPHPAINVSCGCTGGGSWIFMVVVAGMICFYVLASILR